MLRQRRRIGQGPARAGCSGQQLVPVEALNSLDLVFPSVGRTWKPDRSARRRWKYGRPASASLPGRALVQTRSSQSDMLACGTGRGAAVGELKGIPELFEGRHFDREVIILCVRCYLRFKHLVSRTPRCQATDRCDWSLKSSRHIGRHLLLRPICTRTLRSSIRARGPCNRRRAFHPNQPFAAAPTNDRIEEMVPLVRTAAQGAIRSFSG